MEAGTSNKIYKNVKKEEEEETLENDFVCNESWDEDIYLNEEKEVQTKMTKALKDDFVLPSENSPSMSRNMSFQPFFVESSLTSDEIRNIERQKIALEDDFVRSEDSTRFKGFNSPHVEEEKIALEEDSSSLEDDSKLNKSKTLSRQVSNHNDHYKNVNDASRSRLIVDHASLNSNNGLQLQERIREIDYAEEMKNDSDYQLNTMSDMR